ncbi:MAG: hypothetical protein MUE97_04795 [Phycisphaerales bacterium]|jgi:hypothetical protein|nr:hypothetical protein [Phycisphaerales bacterium]
MRVASPVLHSTQTPLIGVVRHSTSVGIITLVGVAVIVGIGGCVRVADRADDAVVGGRVLVPAFSPLDHDAAMLPGVNLAFPKPDRAALDAPLRAPADATDPLSRDHWPTTWVLVPAQDVITQPTYVSGIDSPGVTASQRGEFPTAASAADASTSNESRLAQAEQGVLAPAYALADAVMIIPRAIMQSPTSPVRRGNDRVRTNTSAPGIEPLQQREFPVPLPGAGYPMPAAQPATNPAEQLPEPPVGQVSNLPAQPAPVTTPSGAPLPPGVTPAAPEDADALDGGAR